VPVQDMRHLVVGVVGKHTRGAVRQAPLHDDLGCGAGTGGVTHICVASGAFAEMRQAEYPVPGGTQAPGFETRDHHGVAEETVQPINPGDAILGAGAPVGEKAFTLFLSAEGIAGNPTMWREHDPVAQLHPADLQRVKRCSSTCRLDMGLFSIIFVIKKQFGLLYTTLQPQPYQSKLKSRSSKNRVRVDFIPSLNG